MKKILTLWIFSFAAFFASAFEFPFGDDNHSVVVIAPDDLSEPIYTGTFVVTNGDLSLGGLDRVHHSPFEAFII